ncbi:SDR family NAD(P)-dependent oxidoreductase [Gulosibacter molinativorax]|uniref:KR domain-containing protein n=1 Tax=Gulosibacter molinativorax TaxID=256821 RepID=A0ABT7C537_9MICO|nr:SDR family oxidoreductase [Gulosibacter molinativorax]MDJ1370309.1 KR domain-containing protein [Gulosibacter molinativorax]QUY61729.1 Oxidoreductase, short chain dehydrogenase/reductase family protein [Gulosibacter molinativorax]
MIEGKIALVTGAASGIGRAIARNLHASGARIVGVDRNEEGLAAIADELGEGTVTYTVDLASHDAILAMRDQHVTEVGLPDIIVNAAGFDRAEPFMENDPALWESLIDVNYLGPVRLTHAFLQPILAAEATVKIINISSDAGRVGSMGETVYAGTKGAIIAFTKSLAREMARHGINVNCVAPGPTETPLFETLPEKIRTGLIKAIPFRRLARPEEIAAAVRFFVGPESDYITGQVLSVSGGLTMAG